MEVFGKQGKSRPLPPRMRKATIRLCELIQKWLGIRLAKAELGELQRAFCSWKVSSLSAEANVIRLIPLKQYTKLQLGDSPGL